MTQLLRNVLSGYLARLLLIVSEFLLLPVLAKYLGVADLGVYILVVSSASIFLLGDLGMGSATVRFSAEAFGRRSVDGINKVISTGFVFYAVASGLVSLAFIVGMNQGFESLAGVPVTKEITVVILISATANIFLGMLLSVFRNLIVGFQRYDVANAFRMGQAVSRAVLIVAGLLLGGGLIAVVIADAISGLLIGAVSVAYSKRMFPDMEIRWSSFSWPLFREMLPYSLQMSALGVLSVLIMQSYGWIVGSVVAVSAIPIYAVGFRLYYGVKELVQALALPLVPDAAKAVGEGDHSRLVDLFLHGTKFVNIVSCVVIVPLMFMVELVINAWMGEGFSGAVPVARLLLIGAIVNNLHLVPLALLQGIGAISRFVALHAIWSALTILLGVLLGQRFGLIGVAGGMVLPIMILEPAYLIYAIRKLEIDAKRFIAEGIVRPFLPGLVALACTGILLWVLPERNAHLHMVAVAVYAAVYTVLLFRFGLNHADKAIVWNKLRRLKGSSSSL